MDTARDEGIAEGIKKVALNALKMGKTVQETAELTGLGVEEVEGLL